MSANDLSAANLWSLPIEQAAKVILNNVNTLDDRRATTYAAFLEARVAVELGHAQEASSGALVRATEALTTATQRLGQVTLLAAVILAIATIAGALIVVA